MVMGSMIFVLITGVSSLATVSFDVQPIVPATPVVTSSVQPQIPGSRFVQVRLDINSMVPPEFRGEVVESVVQVSTRSDWVQVADYWPKTELATPVQGSMEVAQNMDQQRESAIQGAVGYLGIGSATGHAFFQENLKLNVQYNQQPPMHLLTAAGTMDRRSGAYFKMKSTPQAILEGARTFELMLEVPQSWRGDILEVRMNAYGTKAQKKSAKHQGVGEGRFLIAVYADGDVEAAEMAMRFVQQQSHLREVADRFAKEVDRTMFPSPMHKLGRALDIYEPRIPRNYLDQWIFGREAQQPIAQLPVDLRVAMLDYSEMKLGMELLASGGIISIAQRPTHVSLKIAMPDTYPEAPAENSEPVFR
jgi:hypothetical protein